MPDRIPFAKAVAGRFPILAVALVCMSLATFMGLSQTAQGASVGHISPVMAGVSNNPIPQAKAWLSLSNPPESSAASVPSAESSTDASEPSDTSSQIPSASEPASSPASPEPIPTITETVTETIVISDDNPYAIAPAIYLVLMAMGAIVGLVFYGHR